MMPTLQMRDALLSKRTKHRSVCCRESLRSVLTGRPALCHVSHGVDETEGVGKEAEVGVVGEEEGTKPRKVLMTETEFEQLVEEIL